MERIKNRGIIPVITKDRYYKIRVEDVEFIEQCEKYLFVMTVEHEEYKFKGRIEDLVETLSGRSFYRVMKKLVVNFDNVEYMSDCTINFCSGISYGIGRNNFLKARRAYKNYLYGYPPFIGREELAENKVAEDNKIEEEWEEN